MCQMFVLHCQLITYTKPDNLTFEFACMLFGYKANVLYDMLYIITDLLHKGSQQTMYPRHSWSLL